MKKCATYDESKNVPQKKQFARNLYSEKQCAKMSVPTYVFVRLFVKYIKNDAVFTLKPFHDTANKFLIKKNDFGDEIKS